MDAAFERTHLFILIYPIRFGSFCCASGLYISKL